MNPKTVFTSFLILFGSSWAAAGIGGSSGGTTSVIGNSIYVTEEVCDYDGRCRQITYRVRGQVSDQISNSATDSECEIPRYDSSDTVQNCVYSIPMWLKKLNVIFGENVNDETPDTSDLYRH